MLFQNNCDIIVKKRTELVKGYGENIPPHRLALLKKLLHRMHDTRKRIIALLEALQDKKETLLPKKHNNIPL